MNQHLNEKQGLPQLQKIDEANLNAKEPWNDDVLNREEYAARLTSILRSLSQPYVMGIDQSYGGGKTFFVKRWQASLVKEGFKTVYFNAWESDFSNDPLAAFLSALRGQLDEGSVGKEVSEKVKNIIKTAGPALIKHTLYRYFGEETIKAFNEGGGKEALDITQKLAAKQVQEQEDAEKGLGLFKKELVSIVTELSQDKKLPGGPKLIIFVDELDRCRPSYATEVLERIKHFFSVPGILFVIAADRKHLGCSFASIYGQDLDREGYLSRFVDNWFRLPDPKNDRFALAMIEKLHLVEDGILTTDNTEPAPKYPLFTDERTFASLFGAFATFYGYPLRRQEQLFSIVNLALRGIKDERALVPSIYPVILFSMLEIYDDFENSCRSERIHGKFQKNLWGILAFCGNAETQKYYHNFIVAAIVQNNPDTNKTMTEERRDQQTIRHDLNQWSHNNDKTVTQMAFDDLKYWNAASAI